MLLWHSVKVIMLSKIVFESWSFATATDGDLIYTWVSNLFDSPQHWIDLCFNEDMWVDSMWIIFWNSVFHQSQDESFEFVIRRGLINIQFIFFSRTCSLKIYFCTYIYAIFVIYMLSISDSVSFHLYWDFQSFWSQESVHVVDYFSLIIIF